MARTAASYDVEGLPQTAADRDAREAANRAQMVPHHCAFRIGGGCTSKTQHLYVLADGRRACAAHASEELRARALAGCGHSLAPGGRCAYCATPTARET